MTTPSTRRRKGVVPEVFLQGVLDSIGDVLKIVDREFRIQYINKAVESLVGRPAHECVGQKCHSVLHDLAMPPGFCLTPQTFATGQAQHSAEWMQLPNGARRFMEYSTYPIKGPDGSVVSVVEVIRDATEKKIAEEQMIQNAKLVSLGEAAAGIAHEVRTPLNAIKLGIDALEPLFSRDTEAREVGEVIRRNVDRLASFVTDILTFARKGPGERSLEDVRKIVRRALSLVQKQARDQQVQIVTRFAKNLPAVSVNANQIQQVVLNVLLNALQAMPRGGKVEISLKPCAEGERDGLLLSVADTGPGIPNGQKQRVFEPFYSTKASGTGLGLAISAKIVKDHGGRITIRDARPQGAVIEVFLPKE